MNPASFLRAALDLLYPPLCPGCHRARPAPEEPFPGLCRDCASRSWLCQRPSCAVCGEPFPSEDTDPFTCATCQGRRFAFDWAQARFRSQGTPRALLHDFKYGRQLHLRRLLGAWMLPLLEDPRLRERKDWLLVPVPLHPRRRREREFNQAEELARILSRSSGLPWAPVLRRTRYTTSQTVFQRRERAVNLRGAFLLKPGPARRAGLGGRGVLLVDDVFTTGSTAHECARVLRREGHADKVVVLTAARG